MTSAPPAPGHGNGGDDGPLRVTSLELFFDLVFVFTLTQLSTLLTGELTPLGMARALLIFGVLWWMYGGYAWLTNTATPGRPVERLLLLTGMSGFLVVALAIPHAFGRDGVAFGLGYLVVVLVHAGLYSRANRNIVRVAPFNIASALLVIGAGFLPAPARSPPGPRRWRCRCSHRCSCTWAAGSRSIPRISWNGMAGSSSWRSASPWWQSASAWPGTRSPPGWPWQRCSAWPCQPASGGPFSASATTNVPSE